MYILIGTGHRVRLVAEALGLGFEPKLDTADLYHATIWSDSDYDGLGSWGDPNNDHDISTGALKDMRIAYPVPHNLRRNFTLRVGDAGLGASHPNGPPAPDPSLMVNTTFTSDVVDSTVTSFTGEYIKFQATIESWKGPHPGPHIIVGGDLFGGCPFGLAPPACNPGPKWAPNGNKCYFHCLYVLIDTRCPHVDPMFFLHHAVCPLVRSTEMATNVSIL